MKEFFSKRVNRNSKTSATKLETYKFLIIVNTINWIGIGTLERLSSLPEEVRMFATKGHKPFR